MLGQGAGKMTVPAPWHSVHEYFALFRVTVSFYIALNFRKIHLHGGYADTVASAARIGNDAGGRCRGIGGSVFRPAVIGARSRNDPELNGGFACLGSSLGVG